MRKHMKNDSGYVLIGVIATFMVLSILSLTMISISAVSFKTSTSERDNQSAFYIAEAGLNLAETKLKGALEEAYDLAETQGDFDGLIPTGFEDSYGHENEFEHPRALADTKVSQNETNPYEYHIESLGQIDGESRTLTKTLQVQWQDKYQFIEQGQSGTAPPFAVFTSGNIKVNGGTIKGDIGTTSTEVASIVYGGGWPDVKGDIFVPDGNEDIVKIDIPSYTPNSETKPIEETYTVPELPEFPSVPIYNKGNDISLSGNDKKTIVIDESKHFENVTLTSNTYLTIDIGDSNKEIVIDNFNLTNGHIHIKGNGRLSLYITKNFSMGHSASSINKEGNINQLDMYIKDNINDVVLSGNQRIYGSLYTENANINLGNSGSIAGNVFTGGSKFQVSGGSANKAQLFFAPNAKFELPNGSIKGRVISREFKISGGGVIEFEDLDFTNGPISPSALGIQNPGEGGNGAPGGGGLIKVPIEGSELSFTAGSMNEK